MATAINLATPFLNDTVISDFYVNVGDPWNYTLPTAINPYNTTEKVVVSASFNPSV